MTVAAHQDSDLGPMAADALDDVLQDGADFLARRRLAFAQDHRHRLAGRPFIDVDRQETALVIMGVEQRELLLAVQALTRRALDLTPFEMAQLLGTDTPTWETYEAGTQRIPPDQALKLSAYGIPLEWIYDGRMKNLHSHVRAKIG